ncbi:MAG: SIMPL domain-containing protein [Brevundimonas sp.]|uniref:SIMPL domain-containing protein n=1 Tax=Brevundimonas sp. TaxID=1871086 RepID=UPI0027277DC5|nr:SIMPL domain-containing protein [Brevundimonas sp.]MDO9076601.1 SIMPL domain-containing protein [Brevundimonas sp.]MDP3081090.1 SIMPL domain-containing protein [Brevundimonas sp.]MDZ4060429.1 SIMPL domain-containing protein [Brevundimonas sp.]
MRRLTAALLIAATAVPALVLPAVATAQTPPASLGDRYVPAPWWMRDPVIASVGYVRAEVPANRAGFGATFQSIDRSAADASRKAADQIRALSQALAAYGVDAVRVETAITTRPIYDQYRDEAGVLRDNVRPDRIARYQADASVSITVRDVSVLERVYATVIASEPTSTSRVSFSLDPDNATNSWLQAEAVKDAARRARAAATNAGTSLGGVRVIDPTGRACETDVLAGWPSYSSGAEQATTVDEVVVTGSRVVRSAAPAPPPPPPGAAAPTEDQIEAARLALQPPLRELTDRACVVYALN